MTRTLGACATGWVKNNAAVRPLREGSLGWPPRSMAALRCIGIFINVPFKVDWIIQILGVKYGKILRLRLAH